MSSLAVLTTANRDGPYTAPLLKSLLKNGLTHVHIHLESWNYSNGYYDKCFAYYRWLKDNWQAYDYILACDYFDVIFAGNADNILTRFKLACGNDNGLLFSTTKVCWPDNAKRFKYPQSPNNYRFLNAGCYIGNSHLMLELLKAACESSDTSNEQRTFTKFFLSQSQPIKLDYYCVLFQPLAYSYPDITMTNPVYNHVTGTFPIVFHAAGNTDMRPICSLFNLHGQ